MGDKFENIQNATIINRSMVQNAISRTRQTAGLDVTDALTEIAEIVESSQNAAAVALFDSFTAELNKEESDKSILRQCWEGLKGILPDVGKVADAGKKIAALFL